MTDKVLVNRTRTALLVEGSVEKGWWISRDDAEKRGIDLDPQPAADPASNGTTKKKRRRRKKSE